MDGQRAWEHSREAQHWRHGGGNRRHPDQGGVRGSRMPQGPGRSFATALAAAFRLLCCTTQSLCFVCTQMAESPPPPSSGVPAPHRGQSPGCQDGTPVPAPHTGQEGCSAPPAPLSAMEMLLGQRGEGLDWARLPRARTEELLVLPSRAGCLSAARAVYISHWPRSHAGPVPACAPAMALAPQVPPGLCWGRGRRGTGQAVCESYARAESWPQPAPHPPPSCSGARSSALCRIHPREMLSPFPCAHPSLASGVAPKARASPASPSSARQSHALGDNDLSPGCWGLCWRLQSAAGLKRHHLPHWGRRQKETNIDGAIWMERQMDRQTDSSATKLTPFMAQKAIILQPGAVLNVWRLPHA